MSRLPADIVALRRLRNIAVELSSKSAEMTLAALSVQQCTAVIHAALALSQEMLKRDMDPVQILDFLMAHAHGLAAGPEQEPPASG